MGPEMSPATFKHFLYETVSYRAIIAGTGTWINADFHDVLWEAYKFNYAFGS